MSYVNRQIDDFAPEPTAVVNKVSDYHDLVGSNSFRSCSCLSDATDFECTGWRYWDSFLSDSGAPRSNAGEVGTGVGIWSIILFLSLFVGGWITTRACGPMNRSTALLNGTILWATTLALSSYWQVGYRVLWCCCPTLGSVQQVQQSGGVNVPTAQRKCRQARSIAEGLLGTLVVFLWLLTRFNSVTNWLSRWSAQPS